MINKIDTTGYAKDDETFIEVAKKVFELANEEEMYVIGIDYASRFEGDFTTVSYIDENGKGQTFFIK